MKSIGRVRWQHGLLVALLVAFPVACADAGGEADDRDDLRAEMDRNLELALGERPGEPELRDVGDPAEQPPTRPRAPSGSDAAAEGTGQPEPESEPETPAPQPEGRPEAEEPPPPTLELPPTEPRGLPSEESIESTDSFTELERALAGGSATLPEGTTFEVELQQRLSTRWSQPGDAFMAVLSAPITDGDREIVPAGTRVMGEVTQVSSPQGRDDRGSIEVRFTQIFVGDNIYPIDATAVTSSELRTVSTSAGGPGRGERATRGAITGAILGGILGGGSKGAVIGAGAGAAAGAARGGGGRVTESVLATGSAVSCVLNSPLLLPRVAIGQQARSGGFSGGGS